MLLARRLDEKMMILLKQGKNVFHIGSSGHEALQVAAADCMRPGHDWAYPYYRDLAFVLQWGMSPQEALECFLSKATDPNSGGRQMAAHYGHRKLRIVSQSSPTGTQFLQAVGAALGARLEDRDEVVYVSAGEGTTSQGDFHEALNWAAREKLAVIFVIQDNKYAISVHIRHQTAGGSVYEMASGYKNLHRYQVDGTDAAASREVFRKAVADARAGKGPALVVGDVVRLLPHSSSDNQKKYRTEDELETDRKRDPIPRWRAQLIDEGLIDEEAADKLAADVRTEVDEATDRAEAQPDPEPESALQHVYAREPYEPPEGASLEPRSTGGRVMMVDAINHALAEEMERNERVVVFGEDVAGNKGGVFSVTSGLTARYGETRCFNSPLAESSIIGVAIGLAVRGWRPVPEIQFGDYIWPAMMQLRNELAPMRYRSDGDFAAPVVVRVPVGGYIRGGPYHSQNVEATFTHYPGLRVVYPSTASDAKGLLKSAVRGDDPVMFLEHKGLYRQPFTASPEPDEDFCLPLGRGRTVRPGRDLTIVTYGALVRRAMEAAGTVEKEDGLSVEVLDLRSLIPWDRDLVLESLRRTNRLLIVHEDVVTMGFGAEVAAVVAKEGFELLDAPIGRVGGKDAPIPYSAVLERAILPQVDDVVRGIREVAEY
ncbi:MAG: tungsten formylmethanofuran dehydrogenase [Candidatus Eisenbacteria bacterium]|nr:tungsten formylmethanofuran dehydrogenase [Candidatus Eisenbacteria bacterium]